VTEGVRVGLNAESLRVAADDGPDILRGESPVFASRPRRSAVVVQADKERQVLVLTRSEPDTQRLVGFFISEHQALLGALADNFRSVIR